MNLRLTLLALFLLPALLFGQAVTEDSLSDLTTSAVDANGRIITLNEVPTTVMIAGKAGNMPANALFLFPEVEQMALTLPKTDQGLGDFFALLRPELDQQSRLTQTASVEEIASRKSDVVLMKATHFEAIARKLDQLGVKNYTMSLETWDEWQREIVELGGLLGNPVRAQAILALYQERIDSVMHRVSSLAEGDRRRILLLQADRRDNTTSYKVAPDSWIQTWMVETAGSVPVWRGANKAAAGWSTVSFEQIAAWDPDLIVLISYNTPTAEYLDGIYSSTTWKNLRAVQAGQVLASPHDMMNYIQPVASWILGLQWLAEQAYPDLFADLSMKEAVRSFYQDFYSLHDRQKLDLLVDLYTTSISKNGI